ncbi:MAG: TetR/AcrR family transcriptional regulator [Thermodesulfobacteriota bacterium]|nr:TetR/AcrR family transcriptional regulator [Thermodesulfobacteriota bacterium]
MTTGARSINLSVNRLAGCFFIVFLLTNFTIHKARMNKKVKNQKKTNKIDRKSQILEAAALVFKEKSYDRATLQDIADLVGLTKATIYHYFKSKHELLYTINYMTVTDAIDRLSDIIKMPISPEEKVRLAFQQHFSAYVSHLPGLLVMLHEKTDLLPPKMEQEIKSEFKKYISLWEAVMREGVASGDFRQDLDPKMITWSAVGMSNWVYKWASPSGRLEFHQIADAFSGILLEGIRSREIDN